MKLIVVAILCVFSLNSYAQFTFSETLTQDEFISIVKKYHPVAIQANLVKEMAKQNLTSSYGGFDPYIKSSYDTKQLSNINYYNYFNSEIKIPTWYGIEAKAGYEANTGQLISDETATGSKGVSYAGVSIPLGKNLFIDQRRAALKQAKNMLKSSEAERQIIANDLVYNATKAYLDWQLNYAILQLNKNAYDLSLQRYNATVQLVNNGDRPAIDTTEALTLLQTRLYTLNEAQMYFTNAGYSLALFLWYENNTPVAIPVTIKPETISKPAYQELIFETLYNQLAEKQPYLVAYNYKLQNLEIDRRLKLESLKPTVNVNYNFLSKGFGVNSSEDISFLQNNYKSGFTISLPLTFAQARGEYKMMKLKMLSTRLDLYTKQAELSNKLRTVINEYAIYNQQVKLYENTVSNYQVLLQGEEQRFFNGESSVFMVNSRETKLLEARQKLAELQIKTQKSKYSIDWVMGNLGL